MATQHKLKITNTEMDVDCSYEATSAQMATTNQDYIDFIWAVYALRDKVSMEKYEVDRVSNNPPTYDFHIKLEDGREWEQTMKIDNTTDPAITFTVEDYWRASEYTPIINARLKFLLLANTYLIKSLKITWL